MDFAPITQPQPRILPQPLLPASAAAAPDAAPTQTPQAVQQSADISALGDQPENGRAGELTEEEQAVVRQLKARDREVRAHEQAHKNVAGPYAGAISYEYQQGPDGQQYAVGGSVPIDVSPEDTPEETITKMEIVIKAALAPAEPSAADRAVAAAAQAALADAQAELAAERAKERRGEQDPENQNRGSLAFGTYAYANQADAAAIIDIAV